jgi:hypothetical protein
MQPGPAGPAAGGGSSGGVPDGGRLRVLGLFSLPEGGQTLNLRRERHSLVQLIRSIAAGGKAADVRVLQYGVMTKQAAARMITKDPQVICCGSFVIMEWPPSGQVGGSRLAGGPRDPAGRAVRPGWRCGRGSGTGRWR